MAKNREKPFWTELSRYGVVHKQQNAQPQDSRRCLLVFVHGLFGDRKSTWGKMPRWVLQHAETDIDVVSFSYPSRSWQRCSIPQAAEDLLAWLETEFRGHRNLLFVTHSTGGLVVKQMLRNSWLQLRDADETISDAALASSVWSRTRRVLNIAVPHLGGSPFISKAGNCIYQSWYVFTAPMLALIRFLTQGGRDWGRNEIIPALCAGNPWLHELETAFTECRKAAETLCQPYPLTLDICAKSDLSVTYKSNPDQRQVFIRGTHKSIKIPQRVDAPIVSLCADLVRQYDRNPAVDLVDASLRRISLINHKASTTGLISTSVCGIGSDRDRPLPSVARLSFGTQSEVADLVVERTGQGGNQPRKLVITGAAGVGKTAVMRHIALKLGVRYLAAPAGQHSLPLLVPMQQISAGLQHDRNYTWARLWHWWTEWGKELYPDHNWEIEWLEKQFASQPVTIILDGVDDFLHNHTSLGFSAIVKLLRDAETRYQSNPNLTFVIGLRNTIHGIDRLVSDPADIIEILRLSLAQARQIYPDCRSWIDRVRDPELLDFILTPLILSNYRPDPTCDPGENGMTRSGLLSQTVRTALARSGLIGSKASAGDEIEIDHLDRALMAIAWLFFRKSRGEITVTTLHEEARELTQRWEDFFRRLEQEEPGFFRDSIEAEYQEILFGLRLAADPVLSNGLLQRTFFLPTGAASVRFLHRHWQEFLLGQYLSLCIRLHNFDELGLAAFHSRIYRMAGESFGGRVVSEGCVQALMTHWDRNQNTYATGNVIAFLTWTRTAIEPVAVQRLLGSLEYFEPLSRLVTLAGLSYRVMLDQDDDVSNRDIRRALFPQIRRFANPETAPLHDPVASSLCWMYQKAFSELFGLEPPQTEWPAVEFDDEATLQALPMVCSVKNGEFILDERARSLQVAFLVPVMEAFNDSKLAIRAMHYLYYLIVARKHGVHTMGLSQDLPVLLAEGSEFEKIIASFHYTPQLLTLYKKCQAYHASLEAGSV